MVFCWQHPLMRLALMLTASFFVADIIFLSFSAVSVPLLGVLKIIGCMIVLGLIASMMALLAHRLKEDHEPVAQTLYRTVTRAHTLIQIGMFFVLLSAVGSLLSYLVFTMGFPLRDAELAVIDVKLGFDWLSFLAWVNDIPWLAVTLTVCYHSSAAQMALLLIALSWLQQTRMLYQYAAVYALSAVVVFVLSGLFPAYGAYIYYAPDPSLYSNILGNPGRWHMEHYQALLTGTFQTFSWAEVEGLVTFPSFHTILAIITAYGMKDVPYLAWPSYTLSALVIVSTLPVGGHFLIDVIAGGMIGVALLVGVRRIDGQSTRLADLFPALPARPRLAPANTA